VLAKWGGVSMNLQVAGYNFKLAADQGEIDAQNNYGFCFLNGSSVSRDLRTASRYFKLAAD
jgi:TPR repeat protein